MGARGPKPDNTLAVVEFRPAERPKPFSKMTGPAKAVWRRIVSDLPANFYAEHELDVLRSYCEAAALNARATAEMAKRGQDGPVVIVTTKNGDVPRKNPWFEIFKESAGTMSTLATKLRLNKNSKLSNKAAGKVETGQPQSRREGLMFGGNS